MFRNTMRRFFGPVLTGAMLIACGVVFLSAPGANTAPDEALPYTVADPAQMAMINVARDEAERQMGRKLSLKVSHLEWKDGWAFLFSNMIDENGDPLDLKGTRLEDAARVVVASHAFCALLKQAADQWTIVETCLGTTGVAWAGWSGKYGAPPEIFIFNARN